ncbi:MAG: hypothetical protein AAGF55_05175 [Pseudomonadota bacterium]
MTDIAAGPWGTPTPPKSYRKPALIALFSLVVLTLAFTSEAPVQAAGSCAGDLLALEDKPLLPSLADGLA